jgi:hypothetical protein
MANITLIKQALCQDPADYEGLLSTLSIVRNLLDCDKEGHVIANVGTDILQKLFWSTEIASYDECHCSTSMPLGPKNMWFNPMCPGDSWFRDLCVYFNAKACWPGACAWSVTCDDCIDEALHIVGEKCMENPPGIPGMPPLDCDDMMMYRCRTDLDCYELCFSELAKCYAIYLGSLIPDNYHTTPLHEIDMMTGCITHTSITPPLHDVLKVLDALCNIVKQKAEAIRLLRKTMLTIGHCDF